MPKYENQWIQTRYNVLWNRFGKNKFTSEDAASVLKEMGDQENTVWVVLAELRKRGQLVSEPDPKDSRKSIYQLKSVAEYLDTDLTRGDLEGLLKKAADLIRTRVDYKFILILLFLKRASDKWKQEFEAQYERVRKEGYSEEEAREEAKASVYHEYDIPEEYLWDNIRKDVSALPERLAKALKSIAERNPELKNVIDADFIQFASSENSEILRQLVELFSSKSLRNVSPDVLGDAYEWILRYFLPQKGKEGEIYTPREITKLLADILDPRAGESVYDPACGTGGMLIYSYLHVRDKFGEKEAQRLSLYGQEVHPTIFALCKMNLLLHGIRDNEIEQGDTLLSPKFKSNNNTLKRFDVVMANPPWNQDGYDENVLKSGDFWQERFGNGFTPRQSADWAWIQHMLASADEKNGRVGVVIDNGALFRGGKEKAIRQKFMVPENDLLECVILLPEKLFYNTGAPGAIMIFNKNKSEERKGKVLFINASNEYKQHPEVRRLNWLAPENIKKIVETHGSFKEIEGFSKVVSLDKIKENDYNLNVSLYVAPKEETERIDIEKEWDALQKIEMELSEVEKKLDEWLKEVK